jgi:hypothetical protein
MPTSLGMAAHTETSPLTPIQSVAEDDAARYVGYSQSYLRQARMYNRGPAFVRVGRAIRYRLADLDAWLMAHRVETRESR